MTDATESEWFTGTEWDPDNDLDTLCTFSQVSEAIADALWESDGRPAVARDESGQPIPPSKRDEYDFSDDLTALLMPGQGWSMGEQLEAYADQAERLFHQLWLLGVLRRDRFDYDDDRGGALEPPTPSTTRETP